MARNFGLYPTVFADEYLYSKFSKFLPLSESTLPNYLFLFIYKITNISASGFLDCARFLNVLFFSSASFFIYLIGKKITGQKTSLFIALLSVFAPINSYTAYFMPESLYYLSFWALTYLALNLKKDDHFSRWVFAGFILGLSALIKPHAIFLVPALIFCFFIIQLQGDSKKITPYNITKCIAFFATAISTKILIGFALAGNAGVTIFGAFYSSVASGTLDSGHYFNLIRMAIGNLQGHLLALCLLFSVPVCCLLFSLKSLCNYELKSQNTINISLFSLVVLSSFLIVVPFFTASVSGTGPYENISRLHMRYYNFMFPLLLLVSAAQLTPSKKTISIKLRAIVGVPITLAIFYAITTKLAPYSPGLTDSPELKGFLYNSSVFYALGAISIFSLVLWIYSVNLGTKFFLYLFMPFSICFSSYYVNSEVRAQINPNIYDNAGIFTKQYLTNVGMSNDDIVSKVAIIGTDPAGLFRTLFHIDNSNLSMYESMSTMVVTSDVINYDLSKLPSGKEWAVIIGDYTKFENVSLQLPLNGYTLVKRSTPIDFTKDVWPGVISKTQGLSSAEKWGTWSNGQLVTINFFSPLPKKFNIHLTAHAFGPNVGKNFVAKVNETSKEFKLGQDNEELVLNFDNSKEATTLQITIPAPSSPKKMSNGQSEDDRNLGIGLVQMRIEPLK